MFGEKYMNRILCGLLCPPGMFWLHARLWDYTSKASLWTIWSQLAGTKAAGSAKRLSYST